MNKTLQTRIKNKYDTEENWTTNNPVLLSGEVAYSIVDGVQKYKVGDGTSKYNSLPFVEDIENCTVIREWNGSTPTLENDKYKFVPNDLLEYEPKEPQWHDDGNIYIYLDFSLCIPGQSTEIWLNMRQSTSNSLTIDWGDGSTPENSGPADAGYDYFYARANHHVYNATTQKKFQIKMTVRTRNYIGFGYNTIGPVQGAIEAVYAVELGSNMVYHDYQGGSGLNVSRGTITTMGGLRYVFVQQGVSWTGIRNCPKLKLIRNPHNVKIVKSDWAGAFQNLNCLNNFTISSVANGAPNTLYATFQNTGLMSIDMEVINLSGCKDMAYTFSGAANLCGVKAGTCNTSAVSTMQGMFYNTTSLNYLDLMEWDVSSVTTMASMFQNSRLPKFRAPNWSISNVTSTASMFNGSSVAGIDMTNWDWSSVKTCANMFQNASWLTKISADMSTTSAVSSFGYTFAGCSRLMDIDIPINTSAAVNVDYMFNGCTNATRLPDTLDFQSVTAANNMRNIFTNMSRLSAYPTHLYGPNKSFSYSIAFSQSTAISDFDSFAKFDGNGNITGGLVYNINDVTNASYTRTLTIPTQTKNHFSTARRTTIANAFTSKGWTLAW